LATEFTEATEGFTFRKQEAIGEEDFGWGIKNSG